MKMKYGFRPVIRIKELLEQKGLTQKDFAEMIGDTPQQLNKWVNGVEPCLSALGRIALTLDVKLTDIAWLAGDDANFGPNSVVYIRGEIVREIRDSGQDILQGLKQHYRWTEEELQGIKIVSTDLAREEVTLGCTQNAEAFITWAKRDREDMYRL